MFFGILVMSAWFQYEPIGGWLFVSNFMFSFPHGWNLARCFGNVQFKRQWFWESSSVLVICIFQLICTKIIGHSCVLHRHMVCLFLFCSMQICVETPQIKNYQIQWQFRYTTIIMNTLLSDSFWIPLLTPKVTPSGNLTCHGFFSWLGFDDLPIDSHSHGDFFSSSQTVTDYRWVNHPFPSSSGKCWIITDRWLVMIYPIYFPQGSTSIPMWQSL